MKIKDSKTFVLNETVLHKSLLVPVDELDSTVMDFIMHYKSEKFGNIPRAPRDEEIVITIALCVLDENGEI